MKNNTSGAAKKEEIKEEKVDKVFYTIVDRYLNFCSQAHLDSGTIKADDKYITGWFSY